MTGRLSGDFRGIIRETVRLTTCGATGQNGSNLQCSGTERFGLSFGEDGSADNLRLPAGRPCNAKGGHDAQAFQAL